MGSLSLKCFRLTPGDHPKLVEAFNGKGGLYVSGRWHSQGCPIVYTSASAALAYLEILAHLVSEKIDIKLLLFEIEIPDSLIKNLNSSPKGWNDRPASLVSQNVGNKWLESKESVALRVPSVIVPSEWSVLINPLHADFKLMWARGPKPFLHDSRLIHRFELKTK